MKTWGTILGPVRSAFPGIGGHSSQFYRNLIVSTRQLQTKITPPTHFNDKDLPPNYDQIKDPQNISGPSTTNSSNSSGGGPKTGFNFREISTLLTIFTLSYLAVDNYLTRVKLEKINHELNVINFKNVQLQQTNLNSFKKRKNLQILNLNSQYNKNVYKLLLHISLLNKQVVELGGDPIPIDQVLQYYHDYVMVNNSIENLNFQNIYVSNDMPELKAYLPNINDYKFDHKSK